MLAQSFVEYGVLQSLASGVRGLTDSITYQVSNVGPGSWLIVGGVALGALWLWSHRPSR